MLKSLAMKEMQIETTVRVNNESSRMVKKKETISGAHKYLKQPQLYMLLLV